MSDDAYKAPEAAKPPHQPEHLMFRPFPAVVLWILIGIVALLVVFIVTVFYTFDAQEGSGLYFREASKTSPNESDDRAFNE